MELVVSYYFEAGTEHKTSLQDVLKAMIRQCLSSLRNSGVIMSTALLDQIQNVAKNVQNTSSLPRIMRLFESVIIAMPNTVFVIDGFDDLAEDQLQTFLSVLRNLTDTMRACGSKIALFGRKVLGRGIGIQAQLPGARSIDLKFVDIEHDINTFVDVQIERFQAVRNITQNAKLLQDIKTILKLRGREM